MAFGHVAEDKKHDRHAMQHFTNTELKVLEELMRTTYPSDDPDGKIKRLHTHSDNAGQHFKSTGSMHYYTTLALKTELTLLSSILLVHQTMEKVYGMDWVECGRTL